jgi:hypothetical protein
MRDFYRWEQFNLQQALMVLDARRWMLPLLCGRTESELHAFHQAFAPVLLAPKHAPPADPATPTRAGETTAPLQSAPTPSTPLPTAEPTAPVSTPSTPSPSPSAVGPRPRARRSTRAFPR